MEINDFSLALTYHESTKRDFEIHKHFDPEIEYKIYPNARQIPLIISLEENKSLINCLTARESVRNFSRNTISLKTLSSLCMMSFGKKTNSSNRFYPSAGGRYPLEVYIVVLKDCELPVGIYHFNVLENLFELISSYDANKEISELIYTESACNASCIFLISAVFSRTMSKYGERGYRYILLDAGHLGQNIYLSATDLNLGALAIGGFDDFGLNALLRLNPLDESVIYAFSIGAKDD